MSCSACSNGLEKFLNKQNGVISASVNLVMASAVIEYDEVLLDQKQIEVFIKRAGFKSTGIFDINKANVKGQSLPLLVFYGVLTVLLMYVSMGHMVGLPVFKFANPHENAVGYAITLIILTIPFLIYGTNIFIGGVKSVLILSPDMNALVTLGVFASFLYSIVQSVFIFLGNHAFAHALYFESVASVIFFVKLGRKIDDASKQKTRQAIKQLVQITPNNATVLREGKAVTVTIDEVIKGETVICKPGEKIAVDGVILSGSAHFDESFITGESNPTLKTTHDQVVAGSINYDGYIEYSAQKIGKESTVSEIVNMVVEASNTKLPIAKTADKISRVFVPCVAGLALITLIFQLLFGYGFTKAITAFVTVLVVACPCALGLATPLAVVVGEGLCATHGIVVKNGKTMEIADKSSVMIFDKTGTLTYGNLRIYKSFNYSNLSDEEVYKITASIEKLSSHPIATAFAVDTPYEVLGFTNLLGYGVSGEVNGQKYFAGNAKLLESLSVINPYIVDENSLALEGCSIVYLSDGKTVLALYGVKDTIKQGAKDLIANLKKQGVTPVMLSGDNPTVVRAVAQELEIEEFYGGILPKDKAKFVKDLKKQNKVVIMCGDGVNDSPALAYADIGVSVGNGTDVAIDSSDVVLLGDGLDKIVEFLRISKKTLKCIKQNLFWAFFYNTLMLPIAMGVLAFVGVVINPMLASIAMVISSLMVILNTLRLKFIK